VGPLSRPEPRCSSPHRYRDFSFDCSSKAAAGPAGGSAADQAYGTERLADSRITWRGNNAARYTAGVLRSFADKDTERVWRRERSRRLDQTTQRAALRKLLILDAAETLDDMRVPPGNRLEKLRGDRIGQYSIRVNQQWRICFRWSAEGPTDIEIVDYH
jgi:toxin HigB-1